MEYMHSFSWKIINVLKSMTRMQDMLKLNLKKMSRMKLQIFGLLFIKVGNY